ncbi:MAG: SDR family oxidoreductase [Hyphomicrobiales bacterium]
MSNPTILITGATGQLGTLAIGALMETVDPSKIAALVRPNSDGSDTRVAHLQSFGIVTREGDYDDPASLREAFAGIDRLLFISSNSFEPRGAQHRNVVDAAKHAGVGFIAYTSILNAQDTPLQLAIDHRETEAMLAASGINHVLLRNGWYMENHFLALSNALRDGVIIGAAENGRFSAAMRSDYAAAGAAVIHPDAETSTRILELAGDTAYKLHELAEEMSRQSGKAVRYENMAPHVFRSALTSHGLPTHLASLLANTDAGAAEGALFNDSGTLAKVIGRPTKNLAEGLHSTLDSANFDGRPIQT